MAGESIFCNLALSPRRHKDITKKQKSNISTLQRREKKDTGEQGGGGGGRRHPMKYAKIPPCLLPLTRVKKDCVL